MRTRTRHVLVSGAGGVVVGAIVVFAFLASLGSRTPASERASTSPSPPAPGSPTPSPTIPRGVSPTPGTPSPTARSVSSAVPVPSPAIVVNSHGGYGFLLPRGYRVAADINAFELEQAPSAGTFTITKGSPQREREYLALIEKLRRDATATEAPSFLPGQTISLLLATQASAEEFDAQLARAKETFKTPGGLDAIRYRRVEGLFTYDVTYMTLREGKRVSVQMTYASQEPLFDEAAYMEIVNSLRAV